MSADPPSDQYGGVARTLSIRDQQANGDFTFSVRNVLTFE